MAAWRSRIAARVRRWLLPDWDDQRKTVNRLLQQVEKSARHRAESDTDARTRLRELTDLVTREARSVQRIERQLGELQREARTQGRTNEQLWRRAGRASAHLQVQQQIFRRLDRLASSKLPILVGPWTGEVGFELLYWIPFVQWAIASRGIDPSRLIAVSRGGAEIWYSNVAGQYVELLNVVSPDEFRQWTEFSKKQRALGRFDVEVLRRLRRRLGVPRLHVLHPQLMYRLFLPAWRREPAASDVESFTQFRTFTPPPRAWWQSTLPASYVAVKIYFSLAFPPTDENRAFAGEFVRRLADHVPVVLLTAGVKLDDHDDFRPDREGRIVTIDHLLSPDRNLDVQTRVLAGASAFIGTYGGFSYLAPFLGVPSISFFSRRDTFFPHHLELAERVFGRLGGGRFVAMETADFDLLEALTREPERLQSRLMEKG
jgi:hypothetical protein